MTLPLYQVDSFTSRPFYGNPAAVCLLDAPRPDEWMQAVAREMNLSETAFVLPEVEGFRLRWFTPKKEVSLCGHATLASAHTLWASGRLTADQPAVFFTLSGRLECRLQGDWIHMDFPSQPVSACEPPEGLLEALGGVQANFCGQHNNKVMIEVEDAQTVRALRPDFARLLELPLRALIVTARGEEPYDFVSRYFGPWIGINEDPVTGSAHCMLTPYWAGVLGREEMRAYQASERGGELRLRLNGERVDIAGQAVTVFAGELR